MAEYNLYIDESGEFRGRARTSVVSGVLEDCSARFDWQRLRQRVDEALPLVPYPFHANLIHEPSLWVAVAMLHRSGYAPVPGPSPLLQEMLHTTAPALGALERLTRAERAPVAGFLQSLRMGQLPDRLGLMTCSAFLRRRVAATYQALESLRDRMRRAVEACYAQTLAPVQNDLVAVAAVADRGAPEPPPQGGRSTSSLEPDPSWPAGDFTGDALASVRRDGYVRALETVFERVLCLLRGRGNCRLNVWVASRYVDLKGYGPLMLGMQSVREVAAAAARFPELPCPPQGPAEGHDADVAFEVHRGVIRYDEAAPMGLVLADYVSNRLGYALGQGSQDLTQLNQLMRRWVGLRFEGAPRHPLADSFLASIAWDGEARQQVRRAYTHEPCATERLGSGANRAQAEQWIGFATDVWEAQAR